MLQQLRLFGIVNVRSGILVQKDGMPKYYNSKRTAKHERNGFIEDTDQLFKVVLGPDHRRFRRVR